MPTSSHNLPAIIEPKPIHVMACPHPFRLANQEYHFGLGLSLADILREVQPDILLGRYAHVWVNDKYIEPEKWGTTFPEWGAEIAIRVVPGKKKKSFWRTIGSVLIAIAVIAIAIFLPPLLGPLFAIGSLLPGIITGLAGLAVGIVGNLVLNALCPPVQPGISGSLAASSMPIGAIGGFDSGSQSSPTLSITGARNKTRLWGPIPFILGKFRVAPAYGARTYTESAGTDQYLRLLFVWGFGSYPPLLEDLKIGETVLENYLGVEVEHRNLTLKLSAQTVAIDITTKTLTLASGSWLMHGIKVGDTIILGDCTTEGNDTAYLITNPLTNLVLTYSSTSTATTSEAGNGNQTITITFGDDPLLLYTQNIQEEFLSILLEPNVKQIRTTELDINEISVEIVCPNGLYVSDMYTGAKSTKTLNVKVSYRKVGTTTWIDLESKAGDSGTTVTTQWIDTTPPNPLPNATYALPSWFLPNFRPNESTGYTQYTSVNWVRAPEYLLLTGETNSAVRKTMSWVLKEPGQYEVKLERLTEADNAFCMSISYWAALRSITYEDPISFPFPLAKTAMRIKASGQLNGTVEEFEGTLTSVLPDWDKDTSTWITRPTQNPASLYRQVAQGVQSQKRLADSRIDLTNLQYWHEYCDLLQTWTDAESVVHTTTFGWKYNKYIDYNCAVQDLLREIASAGRAAFSWIDSKLGVIIDEPQAFTVGPAFTPRNILKDSFQGNIAFKDMPHAFRVPFINVAMQYQQDERIVLDDGYQINNLDAWGNAHPEYPPATVFEQLELPGVTDPDLIFKHARYHIASARLRPETVEFGTDIEWLVATRGDRFKFAHDVMLTGLSWGRVKEVFLQENTGYFAGVVLDEIMPMEAGKNYVLRFRLNDNTSLLCPIENGTAHTHDVVLSGDAQTVTSTEAVDHTHDLTVTGSSGPFTSDETDGHTHEFVVTGSPETVISETLFVIQTRSALFVTPINGGVDRYPAVDDLTLFGEADLEAIDLIIKSIQPKSDLSATIIGIPYDDDIYLADVGTIPRHNPKISAPFEWWTPRIGNVRSDGSALFRTSDGSLQSRILVTLVRPSALDSQITGVEAQYWIVGRYIYGDGSKYGDGLTYGTVYRSVYGGGFIFGEGFVFGVGRRPTSVAPITLPIVPLDSGEVSILPVEDGQVYDFRLRYVKKDGSRGPWGATVTEIVEGKLAPPSNVTGFNVNQAQTVIIASWAQIPDLDRAGYEIRLVAVGSTWAAGTKINGDFHGTMFTTTNVVPGTWDFMIKAIDTSGNYSTTEARKTLQIFQFYTALSEIEHFPLWLGTKTNCSRNPMTGNLNPDDQDIQGGDEFNVFDKYVDNPYATMSYEALEIDLGSDEVGRVWARTYSDLGPGEGGVNTPALSIDYKAAGGAYDGFEPWVFGLINGRYVKVMVTFTAATGLCRLTNFQPVIDQDNL